MAAVSSSPDKPRFKDKFRAVLADAELQQAQAIRAEQEQGLCSLATNLLVNGFPEAFCGPPSACLQLKCGAVGVH